MKNLLAAAALLCCALQSAAQPAPSAKASRASAANGKIVFMRVGCYTCHGTVGHGGAGARLAPNTIPLTAFQTWVRNGTPGWSIERGMPAFSPAVIGDDELADVREFLASLPAPPAADEIPLLKP